MRKNKKFYYCIIFCAFFCIVCFDTIVAHASDDEQLTQEQKEKAEKEKAEKEEKYKDKKDDIEDDIKDAQKQKASLQNNLNVVKSTLSTTKRTIDAVVDDIEEKESQIDRQKKQIDLLDQQILLYKKSLKVTIRKLYYAQNNGQFSMILSDDFHNFSIATDQLTQLKTEVVYTMRLIEQTKNTQLNQKEKLEELKSEKTQLLAEHKQKESQLIAQSQSVQAEIIKVNTTVAELNAKLSAVEGKLSALLGDSFDTDDIVKAAKYASKKTGVRKSFILGMLVVETNLGRYTGGCTYKKSKMGDKNAKIFKRICKDLDYDYKKKKVSCPASYGIGGAMGVAQFMPTTWVGYESRITKYTGHKYADPWSLSDGVMAMAIKLANDGAKSKKGEFDAARRYYCGSRLSRSVCINYANKVLYWAENYKDRL